ncbi:DUF4317 family protein [Clostridium sp. JN-9]|uniref:DUF4317 family protein n=1 Tax=Clostridium sp. JN-9 TaxID=2507159 RepID=UPI000FFE0A7F|nr:DUF4317 family protein [Clostridium sp. JN-9]QAT41238.1 DUF4317 family protein [Clostridium sp. JN-9]
MNKKDLADIRKEFKIGSYNLSIKEVYSVYLKKDNAQIITKELNQFEMMDIEKRELYLGNFKKVLTGTIDSKIFELDFQCENNDDSSKNTQQILYKALSNDESIVNCGDQIVDKISKNYTYDTDIVINFVKAEYIKGNKKKSTEGEDSINDYVQAIDIILCTINKVDAPKKVLKFDYSEMKFKPNSALDFVINLNSPLDGFMFPGISSQSVDVNKIIYYSSKSKQINSVFVESVLNCMVKPTAIEEKESFNAIINTVVGGTIKPDTMQEIYERINDKLEVEEDKEDEDEPKVNMNDIEKVLEESGVENTDAVKLAFEEVCGKDYEFKVRNIVPDFKSRSIKIENEKTNITITPGDLRSIKQIRNKNGIKCLLIELKDDVEINGLKLETEEVEVI